MRAAIKSLRKDLNSFVNDYAKLGAGVAVGAFVALSKGAVDLAGRLSDTSQNIGINVESLQVLEAQHKRNGVEAETFTKALEKVRSSVEHAREGDDKQVAALQKLGLTWQQLAGLPLEKKYETIAKALRGAQDKAVAYNAVSEIFGEKIGPKLMASLDELAKEGFPKLEKEARKAGLVMSAETIVALDRAGDAIDDFKKRVTIAIGNIIVNFRSEEGLKLLLFGFLKVAGNFGAKILDAFVEANQFCYAIIGGALTGVANKFRDGLLDALLFVGSKINKYLPEKFQINVSNIESLKSSGESIADSIARAIANTKPSTFAKDVTTYWDKTIADQQKVVDQLNRTELKHDADALRKAGKQIENSGQAAADALAGAGNKVSGDLKSTVATMQGLLNGIRGGAVFNDLSDEALAEVVRQNKNKARALLNPALGGGTSGFGQFGSIGNDLDAARLNAEAYNAQRELNLRQNFRSRIAQVGVEGARRDFDPVVFENLLRQFSPSDGVDKSNNLLTDIKRTLDKGITVRAIGA